MSGYLKHFVAASNTRASAALRELTLVIPRGRTDQLSRLFLPDAVSLWKLLDFLNLYFSFFIAVL